MVADISHRAHAGLGRSPVYGRARKCWEVRSAAATTIIVIMGLVERACAGAAVIVSLGCRPGPGDNPTRLTDTTAAEFGWACDGEGCSIEELPSTPPPVAVGDAAVGYRTVWGRLFLICSALGVDGESGWGTWPGLCRATTCATTSDCPQLYPFRDVFEFDCVDELCQARDTATYSRDGLRIMEAQSACFAAAPRADTSDQNEPDIAVALAAIDASCDEDGFCSVPDECRAFSG